MIGIISAMDKEVDQLLQLLKDKSEKTILNKTYWTGTLNEVPVVITVAGIGKVNAGVACALLIENFQPELIINTGVCGGYHEDLETLDVIIAKKVYYYDFDISTGSDEPFGKVPDLPHYFEGNQKAIKLALDAPIKASAIPGIIISGDSFVVNREKITEALNKLQLTTAHGVDMESAAIAHICTMQQVPFLIVRSVSDVLGHENQNEQYNEWVIRACQNALTITKYVISNF